MIDLHEIVRHWRSGERRYRLRPLDDQISDCRPLFVDPPATLGRSERSDIVLCDPWVSRVHCQLSERGGELVVRDLESRHGVYVNDQRVTQAVLHPGDTLVVGISRFRVECDEPD